MKIIHDADTQLATLDWIVFISYGRVRLFS